MPNTVDASFTGLFGQQTLYLAKIWRVALTNGVTQYLFTDHDQELNFEIVAGVTATFSPALSLQTTATEYQLGLAEHNQEFTGPVDARSESGSPEDPNWPSTIVGPDFATVRSGALRGATVEEWVVDWRFPWAGYLQLTKFWLTDIEFDNETFRASAEGLTRFTRPKVGDLFSRNCRYFLGRDKFGNKSTTRGCRFDLNSAIENGSISAINTQRKSFDASGLSNQGDGYWELGRIEWLSGDNEGFVGQVSRWTESTNVMILLEDTPFDMQVGDDFSVEPGCNGTSDHCTNKFNNFKNFGGQLTIPGNDFLLRVPRK